MAITKSECLNAAVPVVKIKQVISIMLEVVLSTWLWQGVEVLCHWFISREIKNRIVDHVCLGSSSFGLFETVVKELKQVLLEDHFDLYFLQLLLGSSSSRLVGCGGALAVLPILVGS